MAVSDQSLVLCVWHGMEAGGKADVQKRQSTRRQAHFTTACFCSIYSSPLRTGTLVRIDLVLESNINPFLRIQIPLEDPTTSPHLHWKPDFNLSFRSDKKNSVNHSCHIVRYSKGKVTFLVDNRFLHSAWTSAIGRWIISYTILYLLSFWEAFSGT